MDLQITQQGLCTNEVIADEKGEQPIDCEFTLPDYCPDIERILKCIVTPKISNVSSSGNTVSVDGVAYVNVLYCSKNERELRGYEISVEFSKNFDVSSECDRAYITADIKTDYVNCRAVNERKLDIHGAVTIMIKACCKKEQDVVVSSDCGDVHTRKRSVSCMEPAGFASKQITVNEEIELGASNGSVMSIIKCEQNILFEDCKFVTGKAVVKGNLIVNILYCSDDKRYERLNASFPINQIIEVDGVGEDSTADVRMNICGCELKPITNGDGECRTIMMNVKIGISVCGYNTHTMDIVTDAYSTLCELNLSKIKAEIENKVNEISAEHIIKETIELPENSVSDIIDVWCDVQNTMCDYSDDEIVIKGSVTAHILTVNTEGGCMYFEKNLPYEHKTHMARAEGCRCNARAAMCGCSYNISSDSAVEVRVELQISADIMSCMKNDVIVDMTPDETRMKSSENIPAMIIYYAGAGESIWDIAMRYNTSADMILEVNKLSGDVLPSNKMLLIPSV